MATLAAATLLAGPREKNNILSLKNSITDDDIVFPESFDTDVHKMMTNWYLQNYTVLDAEVENKSPGEVGEETYIRRLAALRVPQPHAHRGDVGHESLLHAHL